MTNIQETLAERQSTHGNFEVNAEASQALKDTITTHVCVDLTATQAEALDNICQKVARIITGNPNFIDSWRDIAGYAELTITCIQKSGLGEDVRQERFKCK